MSIDLQVTQTPGINVTVVAPDLDTNPVWDITEEVQINLGFASSQGPAGAQGPAGIGYVATSLVIKPQSSVTPTTNGDMVFQLTNNTTLVVKVRGSDGIIRNATLTLA